MDNKLFNDQQIFRLLSRFGDPHQLRVLYVSCYGVPDYIRTDSMIAVLKRNSISFRFISGGRSVFRHGIALLRMLRYLGRADVVLVAFRGHEILPLCRLLTRKPVIFDAFVSVYDTLCLDRKRVRFDSPAGKMLKWYDAFLCRLADEVLVDTEAHAGFFRKEFGVRNVRYLYLESPDMFRPQAAEKTPGRFTVFWYGNCWPLQGVDVILGAAGILRAESGIVFRLVGPVRKKYKALVGRLECRNVEFVDHVPYVSLPGEISRADVCLGGHFSNIPKAGRVIAGKTFQFIACGKKTIVGDNPANRELFEGTPGVYFVEMGLPEALAECVRRIREE